MNEPKHERFTRCHDVRSDDEDGVSVTGRGGNKSYYGTNKYQDAEGVALDWVFLGLWSNSRIDHYMIPHEPASKKRG